MLRRERRSGVPGGQTGRPWAAFARAAAVAAVVCAATALTLGAQTAPQNPPQNPPQTPPPGQQPTFRVRIDSVSVDVLVSDKQGNPVTDLTVDDFEIKEAGKIQKIDTFKLVEVDDSRDASPPREILSFEDQRRETGREDNRLFVIFLDDYHVRVGNSLRIRQDLARWVSQLAPRDMVAVMYPLMPPAAITFSRNHDGTAGELMAFQGRKYDYTPRNAIEAQYQMMTPDIQEAIRNEATMSALENLCVYLGTLRDGRKTILLVSEGMSSRLPSGIRARGTVVPMQTTGTSALAATSDLYTSLRDVFVQANRSNTSIYTLDPRGLAPSEFDISENVDPNADRDILAEATDTLRSIAGETDGRALVGRNNPMTDLQQMRRDMSAYYLLSYTSSVAARDGRFHPFDVKVKRRNVEIRARKGYWAYTAADLERASAPAKPPPPRDVIEALENLAATVEPATRRPVVLYAGATRGTGDNAKVTFAWESTLPTGTPVDQLADHVNVVIHSIYGNELFKGPVPKGDAIGQPGGAITFDAPVGAVRVQTVVENARGSRLDSDTLTFDVPDFKSGDLAVSTPIVFRGRTARDLQQVRTMAAPIPTAARAFARAERLLVRFDVFGPPGTALTVTAKILNSNGNSLADMPAPTKTPSGVYESEFGLGSFPPNDYLFEITVSGGGKTTRTLMPVRVTG